MNQIDAISSLRLRASYGINGTLPPADYGWRSLTGYTLGYMEQAGGGLSNAADANLSWETNHTSNIALEFGLYDQRIYGTIEYFNRDSRDLLQSVPISRVTGFSSTLKNIGSVNNKGIELEFGGDIIRKKDLVWSLGLNGAFINSKVTKLSEGADILWTDNADNQAQFIYREGESTLALYGLEYAGVDHEHGKAMYFVNNEKNAAKVKMMLDGRGATYNFRRSEEHTSELQSRGQ